MKYPDYSDYLPHEQPTKCIKVYNRDTEELLTEYRNVSLTCAVGYIRNQIVEDGVSRVLRSDCGYVEYFNSED